MNDGDTSLVVGDNLFVEIAERNMEGIVPLYYEMKGSDPAQISRDTIYTSMTNAYSGGNIGAVSNNITKIWNSEEPNLDMVKILCLENNFIIDYAKTLYKPRRPSHIKDMMTDFTRNKVPYFFMYAKDKKRKQVEAQNASTVNLLKKIIPDNRIVFENTNVGDFDYKKLMSNPDFVIEEKHQKIIDRYHELDLHKYFFINYEDDKVNNLVYLYEDIARKLTVRGGRIDTVVDTLVKYLYEERDSSYKTTLWESFGHIMVKNLKKNITKPLDGGWIMCDSCGTRVEKRAHNTKNCEKCAIEVRKKQTKQWKEENR